MNKNFFLFAIKHMGVTVLKSIPILFLIALDVYWTSILSLKMPYENNFELWVNAGATFVGIGLFMGLVVCMILFVIYLCVSYWDDLTYEYDKEKHK